MIEQSFDLEAVDKTDEEVIHAIGSPSYKDLVEENAYLRSERSQLYDELARTTAVHGSKDANKLDGYHSAALTDTLQNDLTKERNQNKKFMAHFEFLKSEIAHLQQHGSEQAAVAKNLEERLEQSEEGFHAANAELLQILPLRIKLNEMRQKMESVSGESLSLKNEMHEIGQARDSLQIALNSSQQSLEVSQENLVSASRKVSDLRADKKDLQEQIKSLEERLKVSTESNEKQAVIVKEQEERIAEIATDSAHWERKSASLSRELGRFSGSQIQQVSQHTELKEAYAVLKSKLQLREEALSSMIEQSRLSRHQQKPTKRNIVTACVSGTPGPHRGAGGHVTARWPEQTAPSSRSSYSTNSSKGSKGKIVFQSTEMAEEMKHMMASSNRDQAEEDYDESTHPGNDMCSICETFSFLSSTTSDKKTTSQYGII